ncbi:fumarate hydratase, partial [Candidatus Bipolaricaulota bacterium]|nr:fumarate hydratase [Candidatus Bipolaricaulota bacterium]
MENRKLKEALLMAIKQAATTLPADVVDALKQAKAVETSELAKLQLEMILHNIEIARAGSVPMCQDTGILTFFIKAGVDSPYLRCLR